MEYLTNAWNTWNAKVPLPVRVVVYIAVVGIAVQFIANLF